MNIVYNMDCMDYMKTVPDNFFDWAVIDPPYGIGVWSMASHERKFGHMAAERRDYRKIQEWDVKPDNSFFDELFRVSKNQIIWGGNYFSDVLPPSKSFICWDKRCDDSMKNCFSDCEYAWCSYGVARMFRYVWNGMIQGNMKNKEERFHPTQKPVELYRWIFRNYTKPGDKVLDTHLGSGSSRIAAYDAGLDFVGCEIDKEYFDKQEERFSDYTTQTNIFLQAGLEEEQQIAMEVENGELY